MLNPHFVCFRFETGSHRMPHVETSTYCRTAGNLQLRGHVVHGI